MATVFLDTYLDGSQYLPTCRVDSIRASTDKFKVDVSLICENGQNGNAEKFFSTTLYAFDNIVVLSGVGNIIEEYFRVRNKVADMITIMFDNVSMDSHFLYCEYFMPDDFSPLDSFFLASSTQRVHQDSTITIAAVNHGTMSPFLIKAVGRRADGKGLGVVSKSLQRSLNARSSTVFYVSEIIHWALEQPDDEVGDYLNDVRYFSIEYAGLRKVFYIVPAEAYLTFSFRNIFNVEEYIDIVGSFKVLPEVSSDTAVCNGRSVQYNRSVSRSYEIATEPLTSDEIELFNQFVASHKLLLYIEDVCYEVQITISPVSTRLMIALCLPRNLHGGSPTLVRVFSNRK